MDQNTFEASDLLSFDYAVDDELKDNEVSLSMIKMILSFIVNYEFFKKDEDVNCLDHENKNKGMSWCLR